MAALTDQYSGIVLNQNAPTTQSIDWLSAPYNARTIYQTFYLPSNYALGTTSNEIRYPDLAGIQVLVDIAPGYSQAASLDYVFDYYIIGEGWKDLVAGTVIGAHADGKVWFDLIFPTPLSMDASLASSLLRFGVTARTSQDDTIRGPVSRNADGTYLANNVGISATLNEGIPYPATIQGKPSFLLLENGDVTYSVQQGVRSLYYVTPTPLVPQGTALRSDGTTPLLGSGTAAIDFRVLAMTADHGTDFLGNEYRSCVIQDSGDDTDTSSPQWMSPPMPSKFAVLSRYFDVRPTPATPTAHLINFLRNGSFEWDNLGSTIPFDWLTWDFNTTRTGFVVENAWATSGTQSLRSTATFVSSSASPAPFSYAATPGLGTSGVPVSPGDTLSIRADVDVLGLPTGAAVDIALVFYDAFGGLLSVQASAGTSALGQGTLSMNGITVPPTAQYAAILVGAQTGNSGTLDFRVDSVHVANTPFAISYGDGDMIGWEWLGQRGRSISAKFDDPDPLDESIVVDGILVDPLTPNMAFNVYYSTDDSRTSTNMTEDDWEQKLWTRVPKAFVATERQQYVFPEPVHAKYIKVEFTNLQAQSYDPGPFPQPVQYKKFPTWVADFFIAQLERASFIANVINIENDGLSFAYDYYLDDLHQEPATPLADPANHVADLAAFFSKSDASGLVDGRTLAQINLVMHSFGDTTGSHADQTTLLGQRVVGMINNTDPTAPAASSFEVHQAPPLDYSTVSSLSREPVIFEQSLPVMYFFLTCRHAYKELVASFDHNRAYFAGVKDIAFLRHTYNVTSDDALYTESGIDSVNTEINDFIVDSDHNWYVY